MRGKIKNVLILPLIASLIVTFAMLPASAQTATMALNPRVTELPVAQGPGGIFMVQVEIDDVERMLGYEFRLQWNPDVLEYANYVPNEPFIYPLPTIIELGQADIAWMYFPGEPDGLNLTDPYPVGSFIFSVVGSGYSELDLKNTKIVNVIAEEIQHVVLDGYFINVEPKMIADFTAWKAKAEYHPNWDTSDDDINTLRARVWNKGTVGLSVKVVFTITKDAFSKTVHTNTVSLEPGDKATVTYDLNFAGLDGLGTYDVTAQVSYWKITMSQPVTPNGATIKTFSFNANP